MHFPALLNMFTQYVVIKNLAQRHLLRCCNVTSHGINFKSIFVAFITEMEVFVVVLCRYIIKTLLL